MGTQVTTNGQHVPAAIGAELERVLIGGDLSKLSSEQRVTYYRAVCESVGLNPLTRPFDYLTLSGKTVLYAKKDCTEQLRGIKGVSLRIVRQQMVDDCYVVTAEATDSTGRVDSATGAVACANLKGEAKANALMKAETKAKRRVTLSICGLGLLDESEVASIPGAKPWADDPMPPQAPAPRDEYADAETGEIVEPTDRAGDISNEQAAAISRKAMSVGMKISLITDAYGVTALQEIGAAEVDTIMAKIDGWAAKRDAARAARGEA